MKKIITILCLAISLTSFSQNRALKMYKGKFAFCGASATTLTGKTIIIQGKKYLEGCAICPVMDGMSVVNLELVPNPSITPDSTNNTIWSFFWYYDSVPQAPTWKNLPTISRSFVVTDTIGGGMSNMWCMPCEIWKKENGVTLSKCYGAINEDAFPLRKSKRVRKGDVSITQAPLGSTYPVGTTIPQTEKK